MVFSRIVIPLSRSKNLINGVGKWRPLCRNKEFPDSLNRKSSVSSLNNQLSVLRGYSTSIGAKKKVSLTDSCHLVANRMSRRFFSVEPGNTKKQKVVYWIMFALWLGSGWGIWKMSPILHVEKKELKEKLVEPGEVERVVIRKKQVAEVFLRSTSERVKRIPSMIPMELLYDLWDLGVVLFFGLPIILAWGLRRAGGKAAPITKVHTINAKHKGLLG